MWSVFIQSIMRSRTFLVVSLLVYLANFVVGDLRDTEQQAKYASYKPRPRASQPGLRKGLRSSILLTRIDKNWRRSQIRGDASNGSGLKRLFFFCELECGKDQYCSKLGYCRPLKYNGATCKMEEHCISGICKDSVCTECNVTDDCPSPGKRNPKQNSDTMKYCKENKCVACVENAHCATGQVCTSDNRCEECDSDDDCSDDKVCSKSAAENRCVICYDDDHCPGSERCSFGRCVECKEDSHCSSGRCKSLRCEAPVCSGSCSSNSGCISGVCYTRTSFVRGSRTNLFGYCKPCDKE